MVALDSDNVRAAALELARHLRSDTPYELLGLFVEDIHLLRHARSRLAREIMLSGRERPLERYALERQVRAQSVQIRQRFQAAASALGLTHSFIVARGELLAELIRQAGEADALVLSLTKNSLRLNELVRTGMQQLSEAPFPILLLAREGWLTGRCILVADPTGDESVLRTAARLAKESKSSLKIVIGGETSTERKESVRETLRELEDRGVEDAEILSVATLDAPTLVRIARQTQARLVVLRSPPQTDARLIAELCNQLSSALMLVRS